MKLLHIIGAFVAAGAEKFTVDLVRELKRQGHDVAIAGLSSRRDSVGDAMLEALAQDGVPAFVGPSDKLGPRTAFWLRKVLAKVQPLNVHLHTPNTELAYFLATRFDGTERTLFRTLHSTSIPDKAGYNLALARNDVRTTIACSEAVKLGMSQKLGTDMQVIANGIDFHWPVKNPARRAELLESLALDPAHTHFLHVGRMDGASLDISPKAHDVLIDAWRAGQLVASGAQLNLVGDGSAQTALRQRAGEDASIVFHGVRSDVATWLQAADVFVMPSRREGLPIAGIEALGTGIPCIFSDIAPLQELGDAAVRRVPVENVDALAQAMNELTANLPPVALKLAEQMRRNYGMTKVAERYAALYAPLSTSALRESAQ